MIAKVFIAAIFSFTLIAGDCGGKPGESEAAKRGIAAAQPAIEALEKYKLESGRYPDSLNELSPKFLSSLPQDKDGLDFTYSYNDSKKSYIIEFKFAGGMIGMNECSYYSETKKWSCSSKS